MTQPKSGDGTPPFPRSDPTSANEVVSFAAAVLREYLETDSRFTPEMAIERVRSLINSRAASRAFLDDALEPGQVNASAVVGQLAAALDRRDLQPEERVLQLIEVVESPLALAVYAEPD